MRIKTLVAAGWVLAVTLAVGVAASPADAACKNAKCAKPAVAAAKTATSRSTAAIAKPGKRKLHAATKVTSKSAHAPRGVRIAASHSKLALPASVANARAQLLTPRKSFDEEQGKIYRQSMTTKLS